MSKNIYNNNLEEVLDQLLTIIESRGIESEEVKDLVIQYPDYQKDIQGFCDTWSGLDQVSSPPPSTGMDASFYKMLSEQTALVNDKSKDSFWNKSVKWIGSSVKDIRTWAVIGSLIAAFAVGWYSRPEVVSDFKSPATSENSSTMQFANFESASAFEKMEKIQETKDLNDPNDVVLDMLRRRLIFDKSVSVRLSALEVLMQFADHPKVRGYLIESIPHQTEPIVIIELAELMNQLDEKDSAQEWKQLLESDWIETDVRLQVEDKLETIL